MLAAHKADGRPLVLATTSPRDLVSPLAEALGFDAVIATRYAQRDGRYTGRLDGAFVWGLGKRMAVDRWAADHNVDLRASHAYSDSVFDLPLLHAVGHPHPVNADPRLVGGGHGQAVAPRALGPAPRGSVAGRVRALPPGPAALPTRGLPLRPLRSPRHGAHPRLRPGLLASNHRSYFDVAAIGMVAARLRRPVRFMAKQEVFDAPVVGRLARALGGIPVERGSGSSNPMRRAAAALSGRRGGHRAAPGDHPSRRGVLRSGPARPHRQRPDWPPRPAHRSSPSACGGPSRCGPGRRRCPS